MQIFHTINAFYKLYKNEFTLSPWILAGVFYYPKIPKYLNFGGLGTVIGHEITHGFDNTGRNLNYLGIVGIQYYKVDWRDLFRGCVISMHYMRNIMKNRFLQFHSDLIPLSN